jgi:hypothetical protein
MPVIAGVAADITAELTRRKLAQDRRHMEDLSRRAKSHTGSRRIPQKALRNSRLFVYQVWEGRDPLPVSAANLMHDATGVHQLSPCSHRRAAAL